MDVAWLPKKHSKTALETNKDKTQKKSAPSKENNSQKPYK